MEPWQSWLLAVTLGGAAFAYYSKDRAAAKKALNRVVATPEPSQSSSSRKRPEKANGRPKDTASKVVEQTKAAAASVVESASSVINNTSKAAKKRNTGKEPARPAQTSQPKEVAASTTQAEASESEDETYDDKEWARQLEARQKGIDLSAPGKTTAGHGKGRKPKSSVTSSPEAVSDRSIAPASGDVSDMLEARPGGPSVIRIVGDEKPKKQHTPKAAPAVETKKQRQNKRKVEEQRQIREEQEKERQQMLEKQRRTAREARGVLAKNGMAAATPPASNAWSGPEPASSELASGGSARSLPSANGNGLLDTFDAEDVATATSVGAPFRDTAPATTISTLGQHVSNQNTQYDVNNDLNGWSEVTKVKKGKKKAPEATPSEASSKENNTNPSATTSHPNNGNVHINGHVNGFAQAKAPSVQKSLGTNGFAALDEISNGLPVIAKGHPDDDEWL